MPAGNTCSGLSSGPVLWCMQGVRPLSFYRPWLLLTRICHPQNPHASPPVLFYRSCRESDPSFCQSRHALKPCGLSGCTVHLCSYETSRGFTWAHAKRSQRHLGSKASPRKNLEQHNASREHLQWPQQWPCFMGCVAPKTRICHPLCHFMVYAGGQHLSFYRPLLLLTRICHPQNPHVSPPVLFYRSCRESDPSFCQGRHALKQSMWLVWLHISFMFI